MTTEPETRDITLHHKEFDITIKIKNNFDCITETIRKAIFLTPEEMDKYTIQFQDEEGDYNEISKDNFDEAFNSEYWRTMSCDDGSQNDITKMKEKNEQIFKKFDKKESEMKKAFIKMMNEKIKIINENWEKKYDELKQKFKIEIKKIHESEINQLMENMSNYVNTTIESKVENYNKEIKNEFNSQIQKSTNNFKTEDEKLKNTLNNLKNVYDSIKGDVEKSKLSFIDIMGLSGIENNK